ncbi:MAG: NUDIX domain-containing protein [bacterium]|nr:NUDIX domain-containing protein [bacterium]
MTGGRERPLAVVVAALIHEGRILLIRRRRGDYVGLWGLPGGKIEGGEHVAAAAAREIAEETGVEADFVAYLGLVSEHLVGDGRLERHFLLHICELAPRSPRVAGGAEGALAWFPLDRIADERGGIIPSDFRIIGEMVVGRKGGCWRCVLRRDGGAHLLDRFEEETSLLTGGREGGATP